MYVRVSGYIIFSEELPRTRFYPPSALLDILGLSQRIWTLRGFGPPRTKSASRFGPLRSISASGFGPPFADLDPPTKHSFFLIYSNSKLLVDGLKDFNTRSRTI